MKLEVTGVEVRHDTQTAEVTADRKEGLFDTNQMFGLQR